MESLTQNVSHLEKDSGIRSGDDEIRRIEWPPKPSHDRSLRSKRKRPLDQEPSSTHPLKIYKPDRQLTIGEEKEISKKSFIGHWAAESSWPQEYFELGMDRLFARKIVPSLRRKRSEGSVGTSSSTVASDQKPREEKSAPYRHSRYVILLQEAGSHLEEHAFGVCQTSKEFCNKLMVARQDRPEDTLFKDDAFAFTCGKLNGLNEDQVIKYLTPLLVPSVFPLMVFNAVPDIFAESVNHGWNNCIPITNPRPQPDYAVGYSRKAFSDAQLARLKPFVGDPWCTSYLMATYFMYFPFLACEVKSNAAMDEADRQNAHSMTVALKGIVELFTAVDRLEELHQRILGFSISHDSDMIKIWGHYPIIDGKRATFWRHVVQKCTFTSPDGYYKWAAHDFTRNLYDEWAMSHFKFLCSAVDSLPFLDNYVQDSIDNV